MVVIALSIADGCFPLPSELQLHSRKTALERVLLLRAMASVTAAETREL